MPRLWVEVCVVSVVVKSFDQWQFGVSGCDFLDQCYLARDCHAPPAPSQCSFMQAMGIWNRLKPSRIHVGLLRCIVARIQ